MRKAILVLAFITVSPAVLGQSAAAGGPAMAKGMGVKMESRLDSVNAQLTALEADMNAVKIFRDKVMHCYTKQKFLKPSSSAADNDGCVGAKLENYSTSYDISADGGGCNGERTYSLPANIYSEIGSGTLVTTYGKVRDFELSFVKGIPESAYIKKKVEHGGWFGSDEHCRVWLDYHGNNNFTMKCRGSKPGKCRPTEIKYIDYSGNRVILGD
jgi:hypothetical protein